MGQDNSSSHHSRRDFLKAGAGALGALGVAGSSLGATLGGSSAGDPPRPNFVFFLQEGVRPDEYSSWKMADWDSNGLSAMGNRVISTPHLDRIGKEGISFRNAFVTNALCLPSRASILTGLYGHRTGAIDNINRSIPEGVPTIAGMLHDAGYEVGFFGKAHVHDLSKADYWDTFFGVEAAGANYYEPRLIESHHGTVHPPKEYHGYADDLIAERALEWMNRKRDKPFCLFFWFIAPHAPFYRARHLLDLYNGDKIPKPITFDADLKGYPGKPLAFKEARNRIGTTVMGDGARSLEEVVKDHYAGVVSNDEIAGKFMDSLEKAGTLDDTAIVISSDHGFFLGEWRFFDKRFMHEPSIRVPMAIRYPRLCRAGLAPSEMAINLDLSPTVLELAGVKVPDWFQGHSLVPFMKGASPASWRKDWLYEYYEYPFFEHVKPHRGVRTERYKLIHYFLPPQEYELYDLQEDPGELHNLADDPAHAKIKQELIDRVAELRKETGDVYEYQLPNVFEYQKQQMDMPTNLREVFAPPSPSPSRRPGGRNARR